MFFCGRQVQRKDCRSSKADAFLLAYTSDEGQNGMNIKILEKKNLGKVKSGKNSITFSSQKSKKKSWAMKVRRQH